MPCTATRSLRLGGFLVEALDAVLVVRVDYDAGTSLLEERGIFGNAVIAFHLEAVPVGPDRANTRRLP